MWEVFTSYYFWFGIILGGLMVLRLMAERKITKIININNAKKMAESLQKAYREKDIAGIEEYKKAYLKSTEEVFIINKKEKSSAFQLWAAIVIYITHRYADYNFNPYDSEEWKEIVIKTFGNKSIGFSKYVAIDEILNRATKYYMEYGLIRTEKKNHGNVSDYADDDLYKMIIYIINSTFDEVLKFEQYSEDEEIEEKYDEGSYYLGCMQLKDNEIEEGIKNIEKAALSGMPEAQCRLGLIYERGEIVNQNNKLSHQWFLKAAENNHPMGTFLVGSGYFYGERVEKDYAKAIYWLEKAVDLNYVQAQDLLGMMYLNALGTEKDGTKAFDLLMRAAMQGYAHSRYILACMYAKGEEIPYDAKQAVYWYNQAVEADSSYEEYKKQFINLIGE